jgi:hypothetical protein
MAAEPGLPRVTTLVRVVAPHFVAGIEVESQSDDSVCTDAAPILAWCKGKTNRELRAYFVRKNWRATIVNSNQTEEDDGAS